MPQLPLQVGNDLVLLLEGFSLIFESLVLCLNDPVLFPEGLGGLPGLFLEGLGGLPGLFLEGLGGLSGLFLEGLGGLPDLFLEGGHHVVLHIHAVPDILLGTGPQ